MMTVELTFDLKDEYVIATDYSTGGWLGLEIDGTDISFYSHSGAGTVALIDRLVAELQAVRSKLTKELAANERRGKKGRCGGPRVKV